jgi:hypothetical protein
MAHLRKLVAGSVDSLYVFGVVGVCLKLPAQVKDVNIDSTVKALKIVAKGLLDKLCPAENPAWFLG